MLLSRYSLTWIAPAVLAIVLMSWSAGAQDGTPDAKVEIQHSQLAIGATFGSGSGKIHFNDEIQAFKISGLGLGGVGITELNTTGSVYNLKKLDDFYGKYNETNMSVAVVKGSTTVSMENDKGVRMEIDAESEGIAFSLSAEGVTISRD